MKIQSNVVATGGSIIHHRVGVPTTTTTTTTTNNKNNGTKKQYSQHQLFHSESKDKEDDHDEDEKYQHSAHETKTNAINTSSANKHRFVHPFYVQFRFLVAECFDVYWSILGIPIHCVVPFLVSIQYTVAFHRKEMMVQQVIVDAQQQWNRPTPPNFMFLQSQHEIQNVFNDFGTITWIQAIHLLVVFTLVSYLYRICIIELFHYNHQQHQQQQQQDDDDDDELERKVGRESSVTTSLLNEYAIRFEIGIVCWYIPDIVLDAVLWLVYENKIRSSCMVLLYSSIGFTGACWGMIVCLIPTTTTTTTTTTKDCYGQKQSNGSTTSATAILGGYPHLFPNDDDDEHEQQTKKNWIRINEDNANKSAMLPLLTTKEYCSVAVIV